MSPNTGENRRIGPQKRCKPIRPNHVRRNNMDFDFNKLSKSEQDKALKVMQEMCEDVDILGGTVMKYTIDLAQKYPKEELGFMQGLADRLHPDEKHIPKQTREIVKLILQLAVDLKEEVEKDNQ